MDSGTIKTSGAIRPQDMGTRQQVRRTVQQQDASGTSGETGQQQMRRRAADPENLVTANGRTYDRSAPKGTYLNIMV